MTRLRPTRVATRAINMDVRWWWASILVGGLLVAGAALAQDNPPAPPGTIAPPGSQAANPKSPGSATPDSPGTGLQNSAGVIRPPVDVDPAIKAQPPVSSGQLPTVVIPPPGTPGGNQAVQPK